MRVESSATSVSWIPSEAVSGPMKLGFASGVIHYDAPPPRHVDDFEALRTQDGFRFANRMTVWADFDGDVVVAHGQYGGVLMGATTIRVARLGATFAAVPMPDLRGAVDIGEGWVRFTQTTGGRTAFPLPRRIDRAPFVRWQSPLVWTTMQVTLFADGRSSTELIGSSPFPRHWVYDESGELILKAGVADWHSWVGQPSWESTPWGDADSPVVVAAAESALETELSHVLMRGAGKPDIRRYPVDTVIERQGDAATTILLVLDGVVRVDVDGRALADVGPGAVLGERATLESGARTATLTSLTPVRVARVRADRLDSDALIRLAGQHRREHEAAVTAEP